ASGQPVCVVYLTDGGIGHVTPERRNAESTRALGSLGVAAGEFSYLGHALSVPNGLLFRRMSQVYSALEAHCSRIGALGGIYALGWAGGNMGAHGAHVLAMALAIARDRIRRAWQVPFYRASDRGPPFFSLFAP